MRTENEAIYLSGCSCSATRGYGAASALQFAAMQWAREGGCTNYDLWGIPDADPLNVATDDGKHQTGSCGNDITGLFTFKKEFGGDIVSMPPGLEKTYHPLLTRMVHGAARERLIGV